MPRKTSHDLGDLWVAIDEATQGALYALRYRCRENDWTPFMWAQTPKERTPEGFTRFLFVGTDSKGLVRYFDYALVPDPKGTGVRLNISEYLRETALATRRIRTGLDRMAKGLDPVPEANVLAVLALN